MYEEEKDPKALLEPQVMNVEQITFLIPDCCREGWETCPHVLDTKREPVRRNIAL